MSTRRPVPPAGELPEPYPGDTEMLERARIENIARKVHDEELENLERLAYEKEQEARAAKRKAEKVAGIAKWAEAEKARLRKIADDKREQELAAPALPVLTPAPPAPIELPAGNGEWLDIARALAGSMAEQASRICALLDTARSAAKIAGGELTGILDRVGDNYCALDTLRRMVAEAIICTPAGDTEKGGSHA